MKIELRKVSEIKPYPGNPRVNDAVDAVAASIREFGFRQPIVVDTGPNARADQGVSHRRQQDRGTVRLELRSATHRTGRASKHELRPWVLGFNQDELAKLLDAEVKDAP